MKSIHQAWMKHRTNERGLPYTQERSPPRRCFCSCRYWCEHHERSTAETPSTWTNNTHSEFNTPNIKPHHSRDYIRYKPLALSHAPLQPYPELNKANATFCKVHGICLEFTLVWIQITKLSVWENACEIVYHAYISALINWKRFFWVQSNRTGAQTELTFCFLRDV